jgi:(S)-2-hydroxy-acid oxidase
MSFVCVEDFEKEAKDRLDSTSWGHYESGATTELTLTDNTETFNRYLIRPRVLVDVSDINLKMTILGHEISMPIGISPMGMQCRAHPDGERATSRAAARLNTCLILSSSSTTTIEDVAQENGNHLRWFQLFIYKNKHLTLDLIKRAEKANYKALVVTLDTPEIGQRYADERNGFSLPPHLKIANFAAGTSESSFSATDPGSGLRKYSKSLLDAGLTWKSIDWLVSVTSLPVVLKGILREEDAREALNHGVSGIIVSNHGGRQLDRCFA